MTQDAAAPVGGGRYRLLALLGESARASAYRALDTQGGGTRVVKIQSPRAAQDPVSRATFLGDGRAMAGLEHPHIVKVWEAGEEADGRVYVVMEEMGGGSLQMRLGAFGPFQPRVATGAIGDVLDALELAHSKGMVHRHVNPNNVLVTSRGVAKLSDFGSTLAGGGARQVVAGMHLASWAFNAPERRRSLEQSDARSDQYSAAATLFALLTNAKPPDLYLAEFQEELLDPLPVPLLPFFLRACAFEPDKRFPSVGQMRDELRECEKDLPLLIPGQPTLATALPG